MSTKIIVIIAVIAIMAFSKPIYDVKKSYVMPITTLNFQ